MLLHVPCTVEWWIQVHIRFLSSEAETGWCPTPISSALTVLILSESLLLYSLTSLGLKALSDRKSMFGLYIPEVSGSQLPHVRHPSMMDKNWRINFSFPHSLGGFILRCALQILPEILSGIMLQLLTTVNCGNVPPTTCNPFPVSLFILLSVLPGITSLILKSSSQVLFGGNLNLR